MLNLPQPGKQGEACSEVNKQSLSRKDHAPPLLIRTTVVLDCSASQPTLNLQQLCIQINQKIRHILLAETLLVDDVLFLPNIFRTKRAIFQ